jgi:hypothetical protein
MTAVPATPGLRAVESEAPTSARSRAAVRRKVRTPNPPPTPPAAGRLALSIPEAAWCLNCSVSSVWDLIRREDLASFKMRRRRFVALVEVERFIADGGTAADSP